MLDSDTKRRIDTARDILVGKVPDPKSQVEQITIALIYKFMDDMDAEAEELGGQRKFFSGEYARYGWAKLMRSGLGGHESLNLYAEAISKMPENPGVPPLFRDIFKNAFLPYRDPETLRAFLKIIDEFEYDHSERLGDAFEYLLSVLGSQGDAGQFRTPRHIIDFIVEVVDPKKDETVLDPACGTAGFLISAWKHILLANSSPEAIEEKPAEEAGKAKLDSSRIPPAKGDLLTPDERARLTANIKGYDISPDMVRLSLVNLYLHGFTDPHIAEYDTLTSEERWNEHADVILANPPFMSPKGGIRPHNRFSVQSKRSEVLFVDYIAEHLTPNGRAGIIVPEGVIFQSQTAYRQLRKMLVEEALVAVISLPAGVFQPYSGVKTSILVLDKAMAKRADTIAFFKIEHDGFALSAQRRPIDKDDLPQARREIAEYLRCVRAGESFEDFQAALGLVVPKERLEENDDYSLSGERYRQVKTQRHIFPLVKLGSVCTLNPAKSEGLSLPPDTLVSFVPMADLGENRISFKPKKTTTVEEIGTSYSYFADGDVLLAKVTPCFENGKGGVASGLINGVGFGSSEFYVLRPGRQVLPEYVYFCVTSHIFRERAIAQMTGTGGLQRVPRAFVEQFEIPLPPLEVQEEILAEIEAYQKVIEGARAVLDNYRPHIPVNPEWPRVALTEIIDELESGVSVNSVNRPASEGEFGILKTSCVTSGVFDPTEHKSVLPEEHSRLRCPVRGNTIIISRMNTEALVGANAFVPKDYPNLFLPDRLWQTVISRADVEVRYLQTVLASKECREKTSSLSGGTSGSMKNISKRQLLSINIPFPSLEVQRKIVSEIESEQALVNTSHELIARMETKVQAALARVWGKDSIDTAEG